MLEEWELFGGGVQGDSYYHKTDPHVILKLYTENINKEYVEQEFNFNKTVQNAGVKCPEAIRMVHFGERYGIVYQRIAKKRSFSRYSGENPEAIPRLAKRMADMAKELHSKSAEGLPFVSSIELYRGILENSPYLEEKYKPLMAKCLQEAEAEDQKTLLHGDFHFGNIITDDVEDFFIDLGNISYGNPKFDIAMFYLVTHYGKEEVIDYSMHTTIANAMLFWEEFKINYYGRQISDQEMLKDLRKYLLLRTLWIQKDSGNAPYSTMLMDTFAREDCPVEDRSF